MEISIKKCYVITDDKDGIIHHVFAKLEDAENKLGKIAWDAKEIWPDMKFGFYDDLGIFCPEVASFIEGEPLDMLGIRGFQCTINGSIHYYFGIHEFVLE